MNTYPCLFLDRDGTVNEERSFISNPDDLVLIPGAAQAIKQAHELGLKVVIVSNQSGVARGLMTEEDVLRVHKQLIKLLHNDGTYVDAIYYCPHYIENGIMCDCRKPNSGMFLRAQKEQNVDFNRSIVVGDRLTDMEAGKNIGAITIFVLTGYGYELYKQWDSPPEVIDYVAPSLFDSISYIKQKISEWDQKGENALDV